MKKIISVIIMLMLSICLVACMEVQGDENKTQTITDMAGNVVTLPAEIDSIIDTWSAATDNLYNIGAAELLVSAHSACASSKWSQKVFPDIATLPDYSKSTAEELLKVNADMVIVSSQSKYEELTAVGVNAINLMYNSYETFKQSTTIMGKVLGGEYEKNAIAFCEYVDWVTEICNEITKNTPEDEKPVIHYLFGNNPDNLFSTCGGGVIMEEWINMGGGKLATAPLGTGMGLKDVTAEEILATNPDIIVIDGAKAPEVYEALMKDKLWSDITAVKENKVYVIPYGCFAWGRLCGDTPLQALWMLNVLYPEQNEFDIVEETMKYYKDFKKCELTEAEAKEILRMK